MKKPSLCIRSIGYLGVFCYWLGAVETGHAAGLVRALGFYSYVQGNDFVFAPIEVPLGLTNAVAIAGGDHFSLALKDDGTVIGWGDDGTPPQPADSLTLKDSGIYMQALNEEEGRQVYDGCECLLLVEESPSTLAAGDQPFILKCLRTSSVAGPHSELAGNNAAQSPMEGFKAIVFDESRLAAMQQGSRLNPPSAVRIWSGRNAEVFDFEFPTARNQSGQVDGSVDPLYQIYLQTEAVVFPANDRTSRRARYAWERETFAVAKSKDAARMEEAPGYFAPPEIKENILKFFEEVLHMRPEQARVLPYSEADAKVGKRVSQHPLHDTYIGPDFKAARGKFYSKSAEGMLIPEIDEAAPTPVTKRQHQLIEQPLPRVQRVFTMPIHELCSLWSDTAEQLLSYQTGGQT